jgi:hypothetical protein
VLSVGRAAQLGAGLVAVPVALVVHLAALLRVVHIEPVLVALTIGISAPLVWRVLHPDDDAPPCRT